MGIEPDFSVLLTELRSARETIGSHNKALTGRVDQIEKSVNEILRAQRRPGSDLGCGARDLERKKRNRGCVFTVTICKCRSEIHMRRNIMPARARSTTR